MKEHVYVPARIMALTRFSSDRVNPSGPQEAPLPLVSGVRFMRTAASGPGRSAGVMVIITGRTGWLVDR